MFCTAHGGNGALWSPGVHARITGIAEVTGFERRVKRSVLYTRQFHRQQAHVCGTCGDRVCGSRIAAKVQAQPVRRAQSTRAAASSDSDSGGAGTVMVVESPTKANKIQKYLGPEFKVLYLQSPRYHCATTPVTNLHLSAMYRYHCMQPAASKLLSHQRCTCKGWRYLTFTIAVIMAEIHIY